MTNKSVRMAMAVIVLTLPLVYLGSEIAAAQQSDDADSGAAIVDFTMRFAGQITVPTGKGTTVPLGIEIKEWHLVRHVRGVPVPVRGFYIAYLRSGNIITHIGGKSTARRPGEFWTVAKDAGMVVLIKAPQEAAILQTIAVSPAP